MTFKKLIICGILSFLVLNLTACNKETEVYESKRNKEVDSVFNELKNEEAAENAGGGEAPVEEALAEAPAEAPAEEEPTAETNANAMGENPQTTEDAGNVGEFTVNGEYTVKGNMNLLQKTIPNANVLYRVKPGGVVKVLEVYDDWIMVEYSGAKAFISKADFAKNI